MCGSEQYQRSNYAVEYLKEAQNALKQNQYAKVIDRLELAAKEIEEQKRSLLKFVEKERNRKTDIHPETDENLAKLKKLNNHLRRIENETDCEALKIKQAIFNSFHEQKKALGENDYECDIDIDFFLREDDPEYTEREDNVLVRLNCWSSIGFEESGSHYDYGEHEAWFSGFPQSALFHSLLHHVYPRPGLHWSDLLRIGSVFVDIKTLCQTNYCLESGDLVRDKYNRNNEGSLPIKKMED